MFAGDKKQKFLLPKGPQFDVSSYGTVQEVIWDFSPFKESLDLRLERWLCAALVFGAMFGDFGKEIHSFLSAFWLAGASCVYYISSHVTGQMPSKKKSNCGNCVKTALGGD